ncbi:MAG TPA: hypothetical protein VM936_22455 [Pyrinomonadaceae bacterium]|jgi:hypothetical protein|nr:hypothetical protein [Pyrinomonadaceae bacterium]
MIRACPRCGDFYADAPLAFCPADGTPLADVDPHGDVWAEAARVVEVKERVRRRRARRLRLRRVLVLTTTVMITTLVVLVVAVNTYVYLAPQPDAPVVAAALAPTPTPTPRRSETPTPTPADGPPSLPFVPAVTPTPTPSPTPTPTRKTTDTKTPGETCTAADRGRLGNEIVAGNSAALRDAINEERTAVVRDNVPAGEPAKGIERGHGEATLGPVSFDAKVSESCASASVTASYEWTVTWEVFFNGTRKKEGKPVRRTKSFACRKGGGAWRCG